MLFAIITRVKFVDGHKGKPMNKLRRAVMWIGLTLIILLVFLSIYGAFIGPEQTKSFINRLPLVVYWSAFIFMLITALVVFRRLVRVPGLLLIHLGCVFILAGAMWSSETGHKLQKKLFGIDKIKDGQIVIYEGSSQNRVALGTAEEFRNLSFSVDQQRRIEYYWQNGEDLIVLEHRELPFSIALKDFQIEYYKPAYLYIQTRDGQGWKIPVEIGAEFPLGPEFGTVKILRTFENFKITIEGESRTIIDDPQPGFNPALEVQIKYPDGNVATRYAFDPEHFPGHIYPGDRFLLSYRRVVSDYISRLRIIEDERIAAEKDIEVNHPLSFGGYHFYQQKYDTEAGQYTVLMVVSNTGLAVVYSGYWMLCIGVFWHLWLRHFVGFDVGSSFVHIAARIKTKNK